MKGTVTELFGVTAGEDLGGAKIVTVSIDKGKRTVEAKIAPKRLIHKTDIYEAQRAICEKLGVSSVRLAPVYSGELFLSLIHI